jgi:hypothetical protein
LDNHHPPCTDDNHLSRGDGGIYLGHAMTEEPIKPKKPKRKEWVGLTTNEIGIILYTHECRLNAKPRYADEGRLLIFDVQAILKEKNT